MYFSMFKGVILKHFLNITGFFQVMALHTKCRLDDSSSCPCIFSKSQVGERYGKSMGNIALKPVESDGKSMRTAKSKELRRVRRAASHLSCVSAPTKSPGKETPGTGKEKVVTKPRASKLIEMALQNKSCDLFYKIREPQVPSF